MTDRERPARPVDERREGEPGLVGDPDEPGSRLLGDEQRQARTGAAANAPDPPPTHRATATPMPDCRTSVRSVSWPSSAVAGVQPARRPASRGATERTSSGGARAPRRPRTPGRRRRSAPGAGRPPAARPGPRRARAAAAARSEGSAAPVPQPHPVQEVEGGQPRRLDGLLRHATTVRLTPRPPGRRVDLMPVASPDPAVRAHVDGARDAFLDRLSEWLRIPSVGGDPAHAATYGASAQWLAAELTAHGLPDRRGLGDAGQPAVFAEWPAADPAAPTVLVYGHHDVQPVDPLELWDSAPFEPVVATATAAARRAAPPTTRARCSIHMLGLRAHLAATGRTGAGRHLKLLVEGEEESGSPHFAAAAARARRTGCACDVVVVSDTGMWAADVPSMCTGMRGLVRLRGRRPRPGRRPALRLLRRRGAQPAHRAGPARSAGAARRARTGDHPRVLRRRASSSDARSASCSRRAAVRRGGLAAHRAVAGHPRRGRAGHTLERVWARPTAEVNGIVGRLHRSRAARRSSPPTRTPRSPSGSWPARTRPTSPTAVRATGSRPGRPTGIDRSRSPSTATACGRA